MTRTCLTRYLKHIRNDAKRRGRKFLLSKEFLEALLLKQNNQCALSGLPISFDNSSASLDRIKNNIDYQEDNVQWVHRKVNYMKNTLEQNDFITICKAIVLHNQQNN